jgi:hypothetical protein
MAEASRDKPGGLPLLARSMHKVFNPSVPTPEVIRPTQEDVEMSNATRQDRPALMGSCLKCIHYDHAHGQEMITRKGLEEEMVHKLGGESAVARLGDLRQYGFCEVTQGLTNAWAPMCPEWKDKTKILGKLWGGAVGAWKRLGGIE